MVAPGVEEGRYTGALPTMHDAIILGSDHAGLDLKEKVKKALDRLHVPCEDIGTQSAESVDYPDYAHRVAEAVETGRFPRGIVVCGTGLGVSMAANRHPGVRAAVAYDEETARLSREHNDSNVLALGSRSLDHALAERILEVWLNTPFAGERHARRVLKIELPKTEPR
jgi:ribose 5-phosphate isomerase B